MCKMLILKQTWHFFAELEANRAARSKEDEVRRLQLVEEHKIQKAKDDAAEA